MRRRCRVSGQLPEHQRFRCSGPFPQCSSISDGRFERVGFEYSTEAHLRQASTSGALQSICFEPLGRKHLRGHDLAHNKTYTCDYACGK